MKAPAIIASVTIACSLGFAAGQGRPVMPQQDMATPPIPPKDSMTPDGSGSDGGVAADGGASQCVIGEPLNWFTIAHVFTPESGCARAAWSGATLFTSGRWSGDANADEIRDDLIWVHPVTYNQNSNFGSGYCIDQFPSSFDGAVLCKAEYSANKGDVSLTLRPLLNLALLRNAAAQLDPPATPACFLPMDITDMDGDGDLDLVFRISAWTPLIWIENTSVANPPLAADVNRDGVVDGKDLASVLAAWTP